MPLETRRDIFHAGALNDRIVITDGTRKFPRRGKVTETSRTLSLPNVEGIQGRVSEFLTRYVRAGSKNDIRSGQRLDWAAEEQSYHIATVQRKDRQWSLATLYPRAETLLAEVGIDSLIEQDVTSYDPLTGTTSITSTLTATAPITSATFSESLIVSDVVQFGDMTMTVAAGAMAFTPEIGARVTFFGRIWKTIAIEPKIVGGLIDRYVMLLRT